MIIRQSDLLIIVMNWDVIEGKVCLDLNLNDELGSRAWFMMKSFF
jgi:hypothetical protein